MPAAEDVPEKQPVNIGRVIGGAVLGFNAFWLVTAVTGVLLYSTYSDSSSIWLGMAVYGALVVPAVVSLALLMSPRTRYWGAVC